MNTSGYDHKHGLDCACRFPDQHADTVAVVIPCSEAEARDLTNEIRRAAEEVWDLLVIAKERLAWKALGYHTFEEYVGQEFGMSRSRAYQLLDKAHVVQEITAVAGVSTKVDIDERTARDIKGHLAEVEDAVREAVAEVQGDTITEAEKAALVQDVIERERQRIRTETHNRLGQLPEDLHNRVVKGQYDLTEAETAHREGEARLDIWADNLREAMRRLARMAGSPIPPGIHARLDDDELAVLTTILNALGEGDYGFLE